MEVICNKASQYCEGCSHSVPHYDKPGCTKICSIQSDSKCILATIYQRKEKLEKLNGLHLQK